MKSTVAIVCFLLASFSLSFAQTSANGPSFVVTDEAEGNQSSGFAYELFYSNLDRLQAAYQTEGDASDLQDLSSSLVSERTEAAISAYRDTDAELAALQQRLDLTLREVALEIDASALNAEIEDPEWEGAEIILEQEAEQGQANLLVKTHQAASLQQAIAALELTIPVDALLDAELSESEVQFNEGVAWMMEVHQAYR